MDSLWPLNGEHTGDYALVVALVLAASTMVGPLIRNGLARHSSKVMSFGGGVAVTYVFVQLIPEIEEAHEYLGDEIHIIILFSFLAFYAVEHRFLSTHKRVHVESNDANEESDDGRVFWLHVALSGFYTWMIVFALPSEVSNDLLLAIIGSLGIGLHVVHKGYVLYTHHRKRFEAQGRYVLALAPILGWISHIVAQPSEFVFDLSIAVLAGFLMQSVFREELPSYDQTRLRWLIAGALVFLLLVLISP